MLVRYKGISHKWKDKERKYPTSSDQRRKKIGSRKDYEQEKNMKEEQVLSMMKEMYSRRRYMEEQE